MAIVLATAGLGFAGVCDEGLLKEHLPFIPQNLRIVSKREVGSFCEFIVKDRQGEIPVYLNKDMAIVGSVFVKGRNLTAESLLEVRQRVLKEVLPKLDDVVATKHGRSEKTLYMISDPDCPYCESSKRKVYELAMQKGWSVALIWYPLPHNQKGREKAQSFICEKRTWNDYLNGAYGNTKCEEGRRKIETGIELLNELSIGGTPTFILSTGQMVHGANMRALEEAMR